jgi:hypothetical protein
MRARREWFDRFMARRQRIARWSVVLYAAAASAVVVGMWRVADTGNGDTLALLASGYAGLVALTWIGPVLTRRGDQKE